MKKVQLLPNLSEYRTVKLGYDEYMLRYDIEKVIRKVVRKN